MELGVVLEAVGSRFVVKIEIGVELEFEEDPVAGLECFLRDEILTDGTGVRLPEV